MSALKKVREIALYDYTSLGEVTFDSVTNLKFFSIKILPRYGWHKDNIIILNFDFYNQKTCPKIKVKSKKIKNKNHLNNETYIENLTNNDNFNKLCDNNWGRYTFLIISWLIIVK